MLLELRGWLLTSVVCGVACAPSIPGEESDTGSGAVDSVGTTGTTGTTDDTAEVLPGPEETYRLYINELMASNSVVAVDPDDSDATPDWIELHNPADFDVDLSGFTVTDDLDNPRLHTLDGLILPAGGFLVLLADDGSGGVHLPFKLSSEADAFGLFSEDGVPVDRVTFSSLDDNQVAGRYPDDGPLVLLSEPTPGATNDTSEVVEP
jgi:hypothetical protein